MEDGMHDWRWFVAVWAIATFLLGAGLIAANYGAGESSAPGVEIGR
jgi:hypothetical protein